MVPRGTLPSKNVAPPNGIPAAEETDALMVTTVPAVTELLETVAVVAVDVLFTVTVTGAEVLGGKTSAALEKPWYTADSVCVPVASNDVSNTALPFSSAC
jgi:hypothetical protein